MSQSVMQAVENYLEVTKQSVKSLSKVATPNLDDHQIPPEDFQTKGELSEESNKLVLKNLYTARLVRCDTLWTVNYLARHVRKWNKACDKRLHRLMSYLYHTHNYAQTCWVRRFARQMSNSSICRRQLCR